MSDERSILPPRVELKEQMKAERQYRTALSARNYLKLEVEATERGIKPYKLTQAIMTLYMNRKVVFIKDLPEFIQEAITQYYAESVEIQATELPYDQ